MINEYWHNCLSGDLNTLWEGRLKLKRGQLPMHWHNMWTAPNTNYTKKCVMQDTAKYLKQYLQSQAPHLKEKEKTSAIEWAEVITELSVFYISGNWFLYHLKWLLLIALSKIRLYGNSCCSKSFTAIFFQQLWNTNSQGSGFEDWPIVGKSSKKSSKSFTAIFFQQQ